MRSGLLLLGIGVGALEDVERACVREEVSANAQPVSTTGGFLTLEDVERGPILALAILVVADGDVTLDEDGRAMKWVSVPSVTLR